MNLRLNTLIPIPVSPCINCDVDWTQKSNPNTSICVYVYTFKSIWFVVGLEWWSCGCYFAILSLSLPVRDGLLGSSPHWSENFVFISPVSLFIFPVIPFATSPWIFNHHYSFYYILLVVLRQRFFLLPHVRILRLPVLVSKRAPCQNFTYFMREKNNNLFTPERLYIFILFWWTLLCCACDVYQFYSFYRPLC